jgi:hypothetical protein
MYLTSSDFKEVVARFPDFDKQVAKRAMACRSGPAHKAADDAPKKLWQALMMKHSETETSTAASHPPRGNKFVDLVKQASQQAKTGNSTEQNGNAGESTAAASPRGFAALVRQAAAQAKAGQ